MIGRSETSTNSSLWTDREDRDIERERLAEAEKRFADWRHVHPGLPSAMAHADRQQMKRRILDLIDELDELDERLMSEEYRERKTMIAKLPDELKSLPEVSDFLKSFGRSIALSKMCGVDTEAQGEVIAIEVLLTGRTPREIGLEMSERYNMMHGKLAIKSEAILSDFHKAGGVSKIISRTDSLAEIELSIRGETQRFRVSWDEIQDEPYVYDGKEKDVLEKIAAGRKGLKIKAKYATPRSRMQMLWSRCISDGVRAMAPEVTRGAYTPEELADVAEMQTGKPTALDEQPEPKAEAKPSTSQPAKPATVKDDDESTDKANGTTYASTEQSTLIATLFEKLQIGDEKRLEILSKRNVNAVRSLTSDQAKLLITNLQQLVKNQELAAGESNSETSQAVHGPVTDEQVAALKATISAAEQSGMAGVSGEIKAHLLAIGKSKLADLTFDEAREMGKALNARSMQAFFDASLAAYQAKQGQPAGN